MKEITKITFYGQDFTPLADAEVRGHELEDKIDGCNGLTYRALLEQFVTDYTVKGYTIPKKDPEYDLEDDPNGNLLYSYVKDTIYFSKWVGVFRKKNFSGTFRGENFEERTKAFDITLEIRCRFDTGEKAFFLLAMLLSLTNDKPPVNPKLVNVAFHQVMDIFLLFMFKNQLAEAAKKGIFRKYQRFENNDSRPHGTIDIARHIRENMRLNHGKIAYHYREFAANNPVNHLILAACKRLREKFPWLCETFIDCEEDVHSTLNMLQTELGYSKTNVRNIVKENLRPITHPYFLEYEDLRKTCLKILRDESVSIFDADDAQCSEETESLCVDVTWLWEKFLEHCLERLLPPGLSLTTQGINNRGKPIFYKWAGEEYKPLSKYAKPDFVLWPGEGRNRAIGILDAKFKRRWNNFFQEKDSSFTDVDSNKCFRDMVVFRSPRTGVVFPFREEGGEEGPYLKEYHIGIPIPGDVAPRFDMIRVPVPPEAGTNFEEWYQVLEPSVEQVLNGYIQKIAAPQPPGPSGQS